MLCRRALYQLFFDTWDGAITAVRESGIDATVVLSPESALKLSDALAKWAREN